MCRRPAHAWAALARQDSNVAPGNPFPRANPDEMMKHFKATGLTREQWSAMTLYEKFEQVVIFLLIGIIAVIVVASLWALLREVVNRLVLGAFGTLDYATFQVVFGMIFTVVIALEFKRSLLVATERSFGILQVRTIILIALLAITRKFIILDLGETEPAKIAALAGAALALGAVHWLVRDQDRRELRSLEAR
jgi:uncharacterized membrane protein (DUF373 family)